MSDQIDNKRYTDIALNQSPKRGRFETGGLVASLEGNCVAKEKKKRLEPDFGLLF